jgi:hypothetical protein
LLIPIRPALDIVAKTKHIGPRYGNVNTLFDTGHIYLLMLNEAISIYKLFYYELRFPASSDHPHNLYPLYKQLLWEDFCQSLNSVL